jgi:aldose sugar dehydrogenase
VRIHPDGRVPADNPFVEAPDALPAIISYGHRNPQGLASAPRGGRLWSHEHGPRGGDELNVIEADRNCGWPIATHAVDYDGMPIGIGPYAPGMAPPIHRWTPSVAAAGMHFQESERMPPSWRGSLLIGTLAGQALLRLALADDAVVQEERLLVNEIGRIRDVRVGPDGYVYLVTDEPNGALYRIEPSLNRPPETALMKWTRLVPVRLRCARKVAASWAIIHPKEASPMAQKMSILGLDVATLVFHGLCQLSHHKRG